MATVNLTGGGTWTPFPILANAASVTVTNPVAIPIYVVAFDDANLTDAAHWLSWAKVQPLGQAPLALPAGWVRVKAQMRDTTTVTFVTA